MLPEISLNILDISQNSIAAQATEIQILIHIDTVRHSLTVRITDNGCGMDQQTLQQVTDPFYTTRTTRRVGLGIPFFKQEAECTGGSFSIDSVPGKGTVIEACFDTSCIDCMPLGDINGTVYSLIVMNTELDFIYEYGVNDTKFSLNTKEMRELLDGVPFDTPEVSEFIRAYLRENEADINRRQNYQG